MIDKLFRAPRRLAMALSLLALGCALGLSALPAHAAGGWMGVTLQELDDALRSALELPDGQGGVLVSEVVDDSPAEAAGLQRGDIILRVAGDTVSRTRELSRAIRDRDPGDEVQVELLRKGDRKELRVELGERVLRERRVLRNFPFGDGDDAVFDFRFDGDGPELPAAIFFGGGRLGVTLESLDEELGRAIGRDSGLLVLGVEEDSAADKAGIERGDVLVKANGKELSEVGDLREQIDALGDEDDAKLQLETRRGNRGRKVEVAAADLSRSGFSWNGDGNRFHMLDMGRLHEDLGRMHHDLRGLHGKMPRVHIERMQEDGFNEELDEALEELREEIRKLKDELRREGDS